jgi:hypothetical protein
VVTEVALTEMALTEMALTEMALAEAKTIVGAKPTSRHCSTLRLAAQEQRTSPITKARNPTAENFRGRRRAAGRPKRAFPSTWRWRAQETRPWKINT